MLGFGRRPQPWSLDYRCWRSWRPPPPRRKRRQPLLYQQYSQAQPTSPARYFSGTLALTSFTVQNREVVARYILNATVRDAAGALVRTITGVGTVPVTAIPVVGATCPILHLDLGPLNLDLLGLVVDLDRVILDVVAMPGSGRLLGNLLCSVAGLLDNPFILQGVLDRILNILSNL